MSELLVQLKAALIELRVNRMLLSDDDGATENAIGHMERALEIIEAESGPGWAKITSADTTVDVDRKMADAFSPLRAMRWALHPSYRPRGAKGRFVSRAAP